MTEEERQKFLADTPDYNTTDRLIANRDEASRGAVEQQAAVERDKHKDLGFTGAIGTAFTGGSNIAVQIMQDVNRYAQSGDADPVWQDGGYNEWIAKKGKQIDPNAAWRYGSTKNQLEAEMMLNDKQENDRKVQMINSWSETATLGAFRGFTAHMVAGLVDIDTPAALLSGGASLLGKTGLASTKIGRIMEGAANGFAAGTAIGTAGYYANPAEDWTSIPAAGLMGLGFGVVGGALRKSPHLNEQVSAPANAKVQEIVEEYDEALASGGVRHFQETMDNSPNYQPRAAPSAFDPNATTGTDHSFGAASVGRYQDPLDAIESPRSREVASEAQEYARRTGFLNEQNFEDSPLARKSPGAAKMLARTRNVAARIGIGSDASRMANTDSIVFQSMQHKIFEDPSGIGVNNASASMQKEVYFKNLAGELIPMQEAFENYAKRNGKNVVTTEFASDDMRKAFDLEVLSEMNRRAYDPMSRPHADADVIRAADALDKYHVRELEIGKGLDGETPLKGYDKLKPRSGYFHQKWVGAKMKQLAATHGGTKVLKDAMFEVYKHVHPHLADADLKVWADATVRRAMHNEDGMSVNLAMALRGDSRHMLEDMLKSNGLSGDQIKRMMDGITGEMEAKGQQSQTKQRMDVDMNFTASNGIKIMDMLDTDILKSMTQRAQRVSGLSALARQGFDSRAKWDEWVAAGLDEQSLATKSKPSGKLDAAKDIVDGSKHIDKQFMDDMFTYFDGTPIGGGISPMYSRMKKLTNLALLGKLGLTQMAEFGPMIAAVGWKRFLEHGGQALQAKLFDKNSELAKELKHMHIMHPEERLMRGDLMFLHDKDMESTSQLMRGFDNILNKGQHLQGYTSGFYTMRGIQHRIAATAGASRFVELVNKGNHADLDRLAQVGLGTKEQATIRKYIADGTIELNPQGELVKLNMAKWSAKEQNDFALSMERNINTLVQKAMAGESSILMHKDGMASMFFHLKSFPLLAMQKQFMRNAQQADWQAINTFTMSFLTAAIAYTTRQALDGRTENLTASKIANGAFGLSNITGWVPMWTDPVASMFGLDGLRFSDRYGNNGILTAPAAFSTLDRMGAIPGAVANVVNPYADVSNADIRALQAAPIIGNAIGFTAFFNAMKD